jgi:hypothetical protein
LLSRWTALIATEPVAQPGRWIIREPDDSACISFQLCLRVFNSMYPGNDPLQKYARLLKTYWGKGDDADVKKQLFTRPDHNFHAGASILTLKKEFDIFPSTPRHRILVRADHDAVIKELEVVSEERVECTPKCRRRRSYRPTGYRYGFIYPISSQDSHALLMSKLL